MAKVGLVFGGRSVEHRVSLNSARTISRGLTAAGHLVIPLGLAPDGCWVGARTAEAALAGELSALPPVGQPILSTAARLLEAAPEVIFPIVHGTWGEDGSLQGLCEMLDLPYVGPDVTASAVAMDKLLTKNVLAAQGLPTLPAEVVTRQEFAAAPAAVLDRLSSLPLPAFVKPCVGGSSVGVVKVKRAQDFTPALAEALRFDHRALVERGVSGREIECAVLGYHSLEASVLGEIVPGKEFYDYADKYLDDGAQLLAPAALPADLATHLRALAVRAFAAIGGVGLARVDFLLAGEEPWINEINTLPGFTEISMYPRLWNLSGVPLPQLVDRLVQIAFARHAERRQLDAGIKAWMDELGQR